MKLAAHQRLKYEDNTNRLLKCSPVAHSILMYIQIMAFKGCNEATYENTGEA
jgi:hypothetical protein